jgi:hypothetical protein
MQTATHARSIATTTSALDSRSTAGSPARSAPRRTVDGPTFDWSTPTTAGQSRMYAAKQALTNVVTAHSGVLDFGLERYAADGGLDVLLAQRRHDRRGRCRDTTDRLLQQHRHPRTATPTTSASATTAATTTSALQRQRPVPANFSCQNNRLSCNQSHLRWRLRHRVRGRDDSRSDFGYFRGGRLRCFPG